MGKIETSIIPVTGRKCKQWAAQRLIPLHDDRGFARRSNVNGVVEARCGQGIAIERRKDTAGAESALCAKQVSHPRGKKKDQGRNIVDIGLLMTAWICAPLYICEFSTLRAQADKSEWIDNVRYKNDVGRAIG